MEKLQKKLFVAKTIELVVLLCMLVIGFLPLTTLGFNFEEYYSVFTLFFPINLSNTGIFALLYEAIFALVFITSVLNFIRVLKLKINDDVKKYYIKGKTVFVLIVLSFGISMCFAAIYGTPIMFIWFFIPALVFAIINIIVKVTNKKIKKLRENLLKN